MYANVSIIKLQYYAFLVNFYVDNKIFSLN